MKISIGSLFLGLSLGSAAIRFRSLMRASAWAVTALE